MIINPIVMSGKLLGETKINGETWKFRRDEVHTSMNGDTDPGLIIASNRYGEVYVVYPSKGHDLFDNGPCSQIYNLGSGELWILAEGVPLEAETHYNSDFFRGPFRVHFKGEVKKYDRYLDGPFMGLYNPKNVTNKIINMKKTGSTKAGDIVERGLVIDDLTGRDIRSDSYIDYRRKNPRDWDQKSPIEFPQDYWKTPKTVTIEDDENTVSYSPYIIRIADTNKTRLIRELSYETIKCTNIDWLQYLHERSVSEGSPERYDFNIEYENQQFDGLKSHYVDDIDNCIGDFDIERSRKIRRSKINQIYDGLSKTKKEHLI